MKKVIVSLHNGIGDLIITFPIISHLLSLNYSVSYQTVPYNFHLIEYFFGKKISLIEYNDKINPIKEYSRSYDFVVDLNNMYKINDISHYLYRDSHAKQLNRQILLNFLFINSYVKDIPADLNMSRHFDIKKETNNNILIFTHSRSAENRRVHSGLVTKLRDYYTNNSRVIFDQNYDDLKKLCKNINDAKLVITVDTGTLHIAEILKTNWIGLFTNLSEPVLTKYYKYGQQVIQSNVPCSPCNYHGGGCQRNVDNQFNCIYGFDFQSIVNIIDKNL